MKKKMTAHLILLSMLFSLFSGMEMASTVQANGLAEEIFDDLVAGETLFENDLSSVDNLECKKSSQTNLTDSTRMFKKSDSDTNLDSNTYITYYSEHEMTDFIITAASRKTKAEGLYVTDFHFETSEDGLDFKAFDNVATDIPNPDSWGKDLWREIKISATMVLPENTHYLRIYLPSTKSILDLGYAYSWTYAQLSNVRISCLDTGSVQALSELAELVRQTLNTAVEGDKPGMYPSDAFPPLQSILDDVEEVIANESEYSVSQKEEYYQQLSDALDTFLSMLIGAMKIVDNCDDFEKVFRITSDIDITGESAEIFNSDSGRFVRMSEIEGEHIIYRATEDYRYSSVDVLAWYQKIDGFTSDDIKIEAASFGADPYDDSVFKGLVVSKDYEESSGWDDSQWMPIHFTVSELPKDVEYLRITFGNSAATNDCASVQIGSVTLFEDASDVAKLLSVMLSDAEAVLSEADANPELYPQQIVDLLRSQYDETRNILSDSSSTDIQLKEVYDKLKQSLSVFEGSSFAPKHIVDECADFSMLYAKSGDVAITNTSPDKFSGDVTRFGRNSKNTGEYLIYKANEGKQFTYFQVNAWYNKYAQKIPNDMIIEAAPLGSDPMNDESYTALNFEKIIDNGDDWPNDGWRLNHFKVTSLPLNTQYVRVVFGDSSNTGKCWTIQLGSLEWEEGSTDYRSLLLPVINEANKLLSETQVGSETNMCPEVIYNYLKSVRDEANTLYLDFAASNQEILDMRDELVSAIEEFKDSIILALNWPEGATISTVETETSIELHWIDVIEKDSNVTYYIYQGDQQIATTNGTTYTVNKLSQGKNYEFHIVAKNGSDTSKALGPITARTLRFGDIPAPDFSKIRPEDFDDEDYVAPLVWGNDKRAVPYYYYHLHTILNSIRMEEPNRGYVDIFVTRQITVYNPNNTRVQEVYLPITYFYTRNSGWNEYYGSEDVKIRLEAVLEHVLSRQNSAGSFTEYSSTANSLPGTSFTCNYLGQAMRLLREAKKANPDFPSIDPDLFDRIDKAIRKALMLGLTDGAMWSTGKSYSNQYGLLWSATLAYLEYHPEDTELLETLRTRWKKSGELISPSGFYYEADGLDMPYNLGVHMQNIACEYHYMRGTEFEEDLIAHQTRFFDWLSYNFVLEPDGSFFNVNAAASKRSEASSVAVYRKDIPLAEVIPIARAFVRTKEDIEDEVREAKQAISKNGAWPIIPEMTTTGGSQYNPYSVYNRILYQYYPTDEERLEAIKMLPYNAKEYFTQQRTDRNFTFSFIRRPGYYTIFNAGSKVSGMQCFGLGMLWSPEGGTFLANYGEAKNSKTGDYPLAYNYTWGTRKVETKMEPKYYRVYENGSVNPTYKLNGKQYVPSGAISNLNAGDLEMSYTLGNVGNKTVRYCDDGIEVEVHHPGAFTECFPVMLREEDKVEMFGNMFRVIRGRSVFEITFDRDVEFRLEDKNFKQQRLALNQLTALSWDDLKYTMRLYIREPELTEPSSMIQVEMDNTASSVPSSNGELTVSVPKSWLELSEYSNVTRAQFISAVVQMLGFVGDKSNYKNFVDVLPDSWYYEDVLTAVQLGLIYGTDDTHFSPDLVISKDQRILILDRAKEVLLKKRSLVDDMLNVTISD